MVLPSRDEFRGGAMLLVEVVLIRLGERFCVCCVRREFVTCGGCADAREKPLRLSVRCAGETAVLEPDDAVCAVNEAGSLIGLVGDRGLGLTNPDCGGEAPILVLNAEL